MIPPFRKNGNLPTGEHKATWKQFEKRFSFTPDRVELLKGMKNALKALKKAGCQYVYMDGSFVTNKLDPEDFDGCWEEAGIDPTKLDPVLLTFDYKRMTQKAKYKGELFFASGKADGTSTYREFFQKDKDGNSKGIIVFDLTKEVL